MVVEQASNSFDCTFLVFSPTEWQCRLSSPEQRRTFQTQVSIRYKYVHQQGRRFTPDSTDGCLHNSPLYNMCQSSNTPSLKQLSTLNAYQKVLV